MYIPAITFEIVTGLSKIKKKKKCSNWKLPACTVWGVHKLELYTNHALPLKWTMLEKLDLALFNIGFGVAFTMNQ